MKDYCLDMPDSSLLSINTSSVIMDKKLPDILNLALGPLALPIIEQPSTAPPDRWNQKMLFSQGVAGGAEHKPENTNLIG